MRPVLPVLSLVLGLLWFGCFIETRTRVEPSGELFTADVASSSSQWRRTTDGWEHIDTWNAGMHAAPTDSTGSVVHPFLLALLQLGCSLTALCALEPRATSLGLADRLNVISGKPAPSRFHSQKVPVQQ